MKYNVIYSNSLLNCHLTERGMLYNSNGGYSIETHNIWTKPKKHLLDPEATELSGRKNSASGDADLLTGGSRMEDGKSSRLAAKKQQEGAGNEDNKTIEEEKKVCNYYSVDTCHISQHNIFIYLIT
jgi:hypothetical protein